MSIEDVNTHQSLRLLDVFMSEEELPVQIAQIDSIKIDDMDLPEASEDEILEKFTSDTPGADK